MCAGAVDRSDTLGEQEIIILLRDHATAYHHDVIRTLGLERLDLVLGELGVLQSEVDAPVPRGARLPRPVLKGVSGAQAQER